MRMYVPVLFLLMGLTYLAAGQTFFLYKGKIFRMTKEHVDTISNLKFNKRNSLLEYAVLEGFIVIRVSDNIFKLFDLPKYPHDRLHLLLQEEAKTDEEIKQV